MSRRTIKIEIESPGGPVRISGTFDPTKDWSVFVSPQHQSVTVDFEPDMDSLSTVMQITAAGIEGSKK